MQALLIVAAAVNTIDDNKISLKISPFQIRSDYTSITANKHA